MATFTMTDMVRYVRQAAGEDDATDLGGPIEDTTFDNLGYDSIAMAEVALLVERDLAIELPEDGVGKNVTPAQFVDVVNQLLAAPSRQ